MNIPANISMKMKRTVGDNPVAEEEHCQCDGQMSIPEGNENFVNGLWSNLTEDFCVDIDKVLKHVCNSCRLTMFGYQG